MTLDDARLLNRLEKRRASWAAPCLPSWQAEQAPRIIAELDRQIAQLKQDQTHVR